MGSPRQSEIGCVLYRAEGRGIPRAERADFVTATARRRALAGEPRRNESQAYEPLGNDAPVGTPSPEPGKSDALRDVWYSHDRLLKCPWLEKK